MGPKGMGFPADGTDNHGWKLYITSLVMIITAGVFVALRCASRICSFNFGADDTVIIFSLLFSIVLSVAIQLAIENGYGVHKADLTVAELNAALRWFFIAQTPYKVTVCLNKVATILLYLRIFETTRFQIAAYTVMGIVVAWSIGGVGATIFQCVPIAGAWDKSVDATCIDSDRFWVAYAVMNILTDVMVLALPIAPIMSLQLSMRNKLMLCAIFMMGGFVTVTSVLRATSVKNSLANKADTTWNFIERGIWTLIEANAGIIGACLPALRQPLARLFPHLFDSIVKDSHFGDNRSPVKGGFYLSNLSGQASHPGMWRPVGHTRQVVSISGPQSPGERKSDEQFFMNDVLKENDSGSDTQVFLGISKTVDVVRTSFHMDPGVPAMIPKMPH
ncbi:putative PTH11-typeG-protein-coupled receptor [Trichoderma citrinoviride]|uniref:Putative PTH11-typeG-protein-coupled receptor n=1 Tax=Trichoderma citrinoviride TaxID=58853 RepID=A0A2T4AZ33_9HYPO|nr:putative PTH11-typeG-protein-coupled receptor [Trichoderma citrinoviride]PTB62326.1 putative PTH11-typeG-protein-coupled receptor [Trichoderma citrinoviride]